MHVISMTACREVTRHRATKLVSGQSTPGESASVVDLEFLMEGQFLWAHFSDVFFRVKGPFRSFLGPFGLSTGDALCLMSPDF